MSRPARPWFRFYVEAYADPKILRLEPAERWVWVAVLGAARASCEPGRLLIAEGVPMTVAELGHMAGMDPEDVWVALEKMARLGMVTLDPDDGLISVPRWTDRQYESDTSAARTAKYRNKDCDVTTPSLPPSQGRHSDGGSDDIVTDQIQRQITDTERESAASQTKPSPTPKRRSPGKPIPSPFFVSDASRTWVQTKCPGLDWDRETQKLVAWAKAGDKRYADWDQAWRNWMLRASDPKRGF